MSPADDHAPADGAVPAPRQNAAQRRVEPEPPMLSTAGSAAVTAGFSPDWEIPPGEILQAELDARNLTQAELAMRTGLTPKHINQVIRGVANLSSDTALRLERALGIPSHIWNALEANFQDHRARQKARETLADHRSWLPRFPISYLITRGVFAKNDDELTRIEKLLAFFQVADPDAYDRVWTEPVAAGFRRSQHTEADPYATAVWLRFGAHSAEDRECKPYDSVGFAQLLPKLTRLTMLPDREAFAELQQQCARVGVAVEFEAEVRGSRANGAARWLNPTRAMIILSGRYRYHDIFWFSFFHEAAHLILHPKRRTVVHVENGGDDADGQESAANAYATAILVPPLHSEKLIPSTTADEARKIAQDIGVDPGIVAGQLAHRYGTWNRYAKLRRKLQDLKS
jgi:HTH-type transcriptional regulator/antitoxin HigA